jgi:transcriptional regulator with XRE-family HTH domain
MAFEEITFPNNIRNIRLSRGIKMTELARRANLSLSAMSKIEKGVRRMNQKQLLNLCNILDCKLSDVFIKADDDIAGKWKSEMSRRLTDNEASGLKIFGAGLRLIRRQAGKTIQQAAADAGMTVSVYHKLEVGQREIYENEIKRLAKSFGKTKESLLKEIGELYAAGKLSKQIDKVEEKVRSVLVPGSPLSGIDLPGSLYGAKLYDSARKKLVPIFGTSGEKNIIFKKSDDKMIVAPMNLEGRASVYAVIPNVRRLGGVFPTRSYLFVDSDAVPQPGDIAVAFQTSFDKLEPDEQSSAQIVAVREDAKGKLYGQIFNPDEKIPLRLDNNSLHKVVQILVD